MTELKPENLNTLVYKLVEDSNLDESGCIKPESKFSLTYPELRIKDSKFIGNPEDKFETMLFLPEGEGRKGEGGLRTKGYFKFSYKLKDGVWHICDLNGGPIKPAPEDTQNKILTYLNTLPDKEQIDELPLISVITVVLNGEKYLEQTIQSVINQTYPNVEYIIIDGGSTDGTLDIVKKYEDKISYWVSEKDKGIYYAMNKGIKLALGKFISFLGSDDWYEKQFSERMVLSIVLFKEDPIDIAYCNTNVIYEEKLLYTRMTSSNPKDIEKKFIFFHPDSICKLSVFKNIGLYDTSFLLAADYEFFMRAYKKNFKFKKVDLILVNYRLGGFSSNFFLALKERFKIFLLHKPTFLYLLVIFIDILKFSIKRVLRLRENSNFIGLYRKIKLNCLSYRKFQENVGLVWKKK